MLNYINTTMTAIWKKMRKKAYRDSYVAAHLSNTVASQIAAMREARGWNQSELAKKAGMKQSRISLLEDPNYENFEAETLRRIASAFDVGLTIRFIPFSENVEWAANLSEDKLSVPSFEEDRLPGRVYGAASTTTIDFDTTAWTGLTAAKASGGLVLRQLERVSAI